MAFLGTIYTTPLWSRLAVWIGVAMTVAILMRPLEMDAQFNPKLSESGIS